LLEFFFLLIEALQLLLALVHLLLQALDLFLQLAHLAFGALEVLLYAGFFFLQFFQQLLQLGDIGAGGFQLFLGVGFLVGKSGRGEQAGQDYQGEGLVCPSRRAKKTPAGAGRQAFRDAGRFISG
jgi:hypothetical protein